MKPMLKSSGKEPETILIGMGSWSNALERFTIKKDIRKMFRWSTIDDPRMWQQLAYKLNDSYNAFV